MVRRVYAIRYPKRYRDWFSGFTGITIQKETHKHKDHATSRRPQQTTFNATVCMRCRLLTVRAVVVWSLKIDRAVAWLCYGQMFIDQGLAAARHSMPQILRRRARTRRQRTVQRSWKSAIKRHFTDLDHLLQSLFAVSVHDLRGSLRSSF